MNRVFKAWAALAAITTALFVAAPAQAGPYSSLVVFGDSLSDTGNIFTSTGGTVPAAPYFNGRFTNGLTWVDTLGTALGLPGGATASLMGGSNYAFGGARTGASGSPPGILAQIGLWGSTHATADATGLYVVVGGGNDMRDARSSFQTASAADQAGRQARADAAVANLRTAITGLYAKGARNILLADLPDLGRTPEAAFLGLTLASADATARFNTALDGLLGLEALLPGLDIDIADWSGLGDAIFANPGSYGILNTVAPCNGFPGSPGLAVTACSVSAFSDALHPSALMHRYLAGAALGALGIPEPQTAWLVLLALGGAVLVARRRAA